MAKKKKSKSTGLIFNVVIIALAVLTVCTLFMPILKTSVLTLGKELGSVSATGADVFTGAFASEASTELSDGANMIYGLRTGDENTFVAVVMIWSYILTVLVALGTLVFAVLGMLGMKFRLVNTVLGCALVVLALVAFIFTLVVASKNTAIETLADKESGVKVRAMITAYMMFAGLIAGGLQVYKARQK